MTKTGIGDLLLVAALIAVSYLAGYRAHVADGEIVFQGCTDDATATCTWTVYSARVE